MNHMARPSPSNFMIDNMFPVIEKILRKDGHYQSPDRKSPIERAYGQAPNPEQIGRADKTEQNAGNQITKPHSHRGPGILGFVAPAQLSGANAPPFYHHSEKEKRARHCEDIFWIKIGKFSHYFYMPKQSEMSIEHNLPRKLDRGVIYRSIRLNLM